MALPKTGVGKIECLPLASGSLLSVVGESHRQDTLEALVAECGPTPPLTVDDFALEVSLAEELPWFTAALIAEPTNPYDPNAISVWSPRGMIGYLSRSDAVEYQPVMAALQAAGVSGGVCSAFLRRADNGMLGAVLTVSRPDICLAVLSGEAYDEDDEWDDDDDDDD